MSVVSSLVFVLFIVAWMCSQELFFMVKMSSLEQILLVWDFLQSPKVVMFLSAVSVIFSCVLSWSIFYMGSKFNLNKFYLIFLSFVVSMMVLISSDSLLSMLLGWEGLGVTSVVLIMFYQNWNSSNNSMTTLLTSRIGDAMLLLILGALLIEGQAMNFFYKSYWIVLLFLLFTLTKSAQWPFMSWLPAAMAAPTPVSALVHSSTLVTAGVWVILRFSSLTLLSYKLWFLLGLVTLMSSSLAALLEMDGKKLVALSTLSQLGLMFISLVIGNKTFCFMHVINHAFAKANLFLMVGSLLHFHFSSQDSRNLLMFKAISLSTLISLFSLTGMIFSSGFFSKEMILTNSYSDTNSALSFMLWMIVVVLTVSYCVKLMSLTMSMHKSSKLEQESFLSSVLLWSSLPLAAMSFMSGLWMSKNYCAVSLVSSSHLGLVWILLVVGVSAMLLISLTASMKGFLLLEASTQFLSKILNSSSVSFSLETWLEATFIANFSVLYSLVTKTFIVMALFSLSMFLL